MRLQRGDLTEVDDEDAVVSSETIAEVNPKRHGDVWIKGVAGGHRRRQQKLIVSKYVSTFI